MKKLFSIIIFFLVSSFGFTQNQNKTATAMLAIQPPLDAVWGEIYCYCVEYIELAKADEKDAVWKSIYVVPSIDLKGEYTETFCILTNLISFKRYIVRVYAFYCGHGYNGYGKYGNETLFRTLQNGGDALIVVDCGSLNIDRCV